MTLTIELKPSTERRLERLARERGIAPTEAAMELLQERVDLMSFLADSLKTSGAATSNREYMELLRTLLVLTARDSSKESMLDGAIRLYVARVLSLGRAAALAGLSEAEMIDALGEASVPVFQYTAQEAIKESETV